MDLHNTKCPVCKEVMNHCEQVEDTEEHIKDGFNCTPCNMMVYTYRFKDERGNVVERIFGETDETGHPTKFTWQDLEDLTITLVDGIMPSITDQLQKTTKYYERAGYQDMPNSLVSDIRGELKDLLEKEVPEAIKQFFKSDLLETEGCLHDYQLAPGCGAWVCTACNKHKGLARCYCGWNLQPGEVLEDDVPY